MPDQDTTLDEAESTAEVRSEPTEVTVAVIPSDGEDHGEPESTGGIVIRHVLERQLVAGQGVSAHIVDAATDVTVAVVHAPAAVIDEVRGGATLPAALARTGASVRDVVSGAGDRVRIAVGGYVGSQATLPNAVVMGAADVAEAVARAQGTVTVSALNAAFTVATVASQRGDVREAFGRERRDVGATANDARDRIDESLRRARDEIRGAIKDYDELVDAS
jgi:hypothetical protein